jgi:hypothetical protein
MTLKELQDYNRTFLIQKSNRPKGLAQVKDERDEAAAKETETKKPAGSAGGVPNLKPKDAKRVTQAEDKYEAALNKLLKETDMTEEDKREALGFALMKFGAKAMAGKSQYMAQNVGEAVEAGVDDYVSRLNSAKKDKKELTKTLAEYGLTKEKIAATRENTAEQVASRRQIAQMRSEDKLREEWRELYGMQPRLIDGKVNPNYKPLDQYAREQGFNIGGPQSTVAAPTGQRAPIGDLIKSR